MKYAYCSSYECMRANKQLIKDKQLPKECYTFVLKEKPIKDRCPDCGNFVYYTYGKPLGLSRGRRRPSEIKKEKITL